MRNPDVTSGAHVRFRLKNVVCPNSDQVADNLTNDLELRGTIVFLSDAGEKRDHYAIVEVKGIVSPLIVPIERVEFCPTDSVTTMAQVVKS